MKTLMSIGMLCIAASLAAQSTLLHYACGGDYPDTVIARDSTALGYLWNTGDTTRSTTVDLAGTYWVAVHTPENTFYIDTIRVENLDTPVIEYISTPSFSSNIYVFWVHGSNFEAEGVTWVIDTTTYKGDTMILHVFPWQNPSKPSWYNIEITATNACGTDYYCRQIQPLLTGYGECVSIGLSTPQRIKPLLFPNPFSHRLYLREKEPIRRIQLYTLQGACVLDIDHPGDVIDVGALPTGVYIARIETERSVWTRKVVRE